jgi:predicted CxxxxCH...CXXCH cytochrome family protein
MDTTSPSFHAFYVNQGLAACQTCHREDLTGGVTGVACATCHEEAGDLPPGVTTWQENCVMCHGGTDNLTGAPPKAIWGQAGDPARGGGTADPVRVGAHTTHVSESDIAPVFGCAVCHVVPTDALTPGHVGGGTATVTFGGLAVNGVSPAPGWDRGSATCSNTYCHGATMGRTTPIVWTQVGQGEGDCGTCHGLPPPTPHPAVDTSGGLAGCSGCHPLTIDATGRLTPPREGGAHMNGLLEALGHETTWMDTTSPDFHAFSVNRNISSCKGCHGDDLAGGAVGVGCAQCHDAALPTGVASWSVNCVMCHGGIDSQNGAPPKATWGNAGDPARGGGVADPLRVGAHTKHMATALMGSLDCGACHVEPTDALSPGHIVSGDSIATVTWGDMAVHGGTQPSWDRSAGTCASTYCHGNYSGVYAYFVWDWGAEDLVPMYAPYSGARATPGWADGPVTCGSCHGNPPAASGTWHTRYHGNLGYQRDCQTCHPDAKSVNGVGTEITNPALHINGVVEVTPRWTSACWGCH